MWAKDEQHAVKVANERRAFFLANDWWVMGAKHQF